MSQYDIVAGDRSGGTNTSHTIILPALQSLIASVDADADLARYEKAVVVENVLGKDTVASRKRTFRYLRELYILRPEAILFRALRDLWNDDAAGQPLLAGLCALARDSVFRASASAVLDATVGNEVTSADLASAVEKVFPDAYSEATLAKIGRNTFSSWQQTGHLEQGKPAEKIRRRPECTPATTAYALLVGYLDGERGGALLDTLWASALDQPKTSLVEMATVASRRMLIDFRNSGGVIDIGFSELLRRIEGRLL